MLKAAIEKIAELAANVTYTIEGRTYSDNGLVLIEAPRYKPSIVEVSGLGSLADLIKTEIEKLNAPIFVEVESYKNVIAYSTYNERFERQNLYKAVSDTPSFEVGWMDYDQAMIFFRSKFEQNEGTEYILDLLSKVTDENSVKSTDNGLSQTVEARTGIALKEKVSIKPRVALRPFRTFKEVDQPQSEFLLRLKEGGQIGLFEADGGMWKLDAKDRILWFFQVALKDLINDGKVIVMR